MIDIYYEEYFRNKINFKKIKEIEKISYKKFMQNLKDNKLKSFRVYYLDIDTGIDELNDILKRKYKSIADRCRGMSGDKYGHYKGMYYPTIMEWVEFCNKNKDELIVLWNNYLVNNRELKYCISIDRINDNKGYELNNIEFVSHGFNSWKRSIDRPIKAKMSHEKDWRYFFTCEEADRYFNIRERSTSEVLRKTKYHIKGYDIELSTQKDVLSNNKISTLKEYYEEFIK